MRGGARPGSGRKRKSLREHLLNGTYRRDRHGPVPGSTNVVRMPDRSETDGDRWAPTTAQLRALGRPGRVFLMDVIAMNDVAPGESHLLLSAADAKDAVGRLKTLMRRAKTFRERLTCERLLLEHQRRFEGLMMQLTRNTNAPENADYET